MDMKGYVERFIKKAALREDRGDGPGRKVYDWFFPSERYAVDFADNFTAEGWLQFDTDQDASYFGVWVNPLLLVSLSYAEGDWTLSQAPDAEGYNRMIQEMTDFYRPGQIAVAYDYDADPPTRTVFRQDRAKFLVEVTS